MSPTHELRVVQPDFARDTALLPMSPTQPVRVDQPDFIRDTALLPMSPTHELMVFQPDFIRDTATEIALSPRSNAVSSNFARLKFSKHFLIGSVTCSFIHALIPDTISKIPCNNPSIRNDPSSAMTVDGEWIPNNSLKPLTNGSTMFSLIHVPIPAIASFIPLKIPATIFPPHSSIFPLK